MTTRISSTSSTTRTRWPPEFSATVSILSQGRHHCEHSTTKKNNITVMVRYESRGVGRGHPRPGLTGGTTVGLGVEREPQMTETKSAKPGIRDTSNRPGRISVFLLDDHEVVRRGVGELLTAEQDIDVIGEAGTVTAALQRLPALRPDD